MFVQLTVITLLTDMQSSMHGCSKLFGILYLICCKLNHYCRTSVPVLDAAGKLPPSVLRGRFTWVGDYDACNNITVAETNTSSGFTGQYTWIQIGSKVPIVSIANWATIFTWKGYSVYM